MILVVHGSQHKLPAGLLPPISEQRRIRIADPELAQPPSPSCDVLPDPRIVIVEQSRHPLFGCFRVGSAAGKGIQIGDVADRLAHDLDGQRERIRPVVVGREGELDQLLHQLPMLAAETQRAIDHQRLQTLDASELV